MSVIWSFSDPDSLFKSESDQAREEKGAEWVHVEGDQIFSDFGAWRAGDGVIGANKSVGGISWVPS